MHSDCDKMRDHLAELVDETLTQHSLEAVRQHLRRCSECRDYWLAVKQQDEQLADFFGRFDEPLQRMQAGVINTLNQMDTAALKKTRLFSAATLATALGRHGLAAAVIVVVTVYFVITFSWIRQINECMRLCM